MLDILVLLLFTPTERDPMSLHFLLELVNRDRTIGVGIHFLKEEFYLVFSYFRVDMPQKL
jgi:hypothetical protein